MIPPELADLYARVCYWVTPDQGQPYALRVGALGPPELEAALLRQGASEWAYLTAHNPLSQATSPETNAARQEALVAELQAAGYALVPGYGEGLEGWPDEASVLALGLGPAAARRIAVRYRQAAFLAGRRGEAARLEPGLEPEP